MSDVLHGAPRRQLSVWHAISVCVGMVIGAGIFSTTPAAAANVSSSSVLMWTWAFGGALSVAGALCYAEMAAAFPDAGGDYFFLYRAYGPRVGFLFAWSRFAVIHTGSMAMLAFVFGDYLGQVVHLGPHGSALFAALIVIVLVTLNLAGLRFGINTQVALMSIVLLGLASVGAAGLWLSLHGVPPATVAVATGGALQAPVTHWGTALVFVFLAYGGWSDAATLSAEMRDGDHGIKRALLLGMGTVTALYLIVNWALLRGLGLAGLAATDAPAADLMLRAFGRPGQVLIVTVVAITSITVMNALLIAGARTTYAAARDTVTLRHLGRWHVVRGTPPLAIIAIGAVALMLVGFGAYTRHGFTTMVDYLSPVYWFFLALSGGAYFVLRQRHSQVRRPFRAPWYPWLPLGFVASSAFVFYSSVAHVKVGAITGVVVMLLGVLLMLPIRFAPRTDA
jgi:basic amino acid/polyamine antiporter, APA family